MSDNLSAYPSDERIKQFLDHVMDEAKELGVNLFVASPNIHILYPVPTSTMTFISPNYIDDIRVRDFMNDYMEFTARYDADYTFDDLYKVLQVINFDVNCINSNVTCEYEVFPGLNQNLFIRTNEKRDELEFVFKNAENGYAMAKFVFGKDKVIVVPQESKGAIDGNGEGCCLDYNLSATFDSSTGLRSTSDWAVCLMAYSFQVNRMIKKIMRDFGGVV